ncbi:MAG: GbsR/MarR family transcriptional regulator [Nannocystaceae bacterium]
MSTEAKDDLAEVRERFINQWGTFGSAWGINRTMAQIHALLLVSDESQSTDEVMDVLAISRGNANTNLRELVGWGLARKVHRRGERREYFEAEKDVWTIFCTVARERKRREVEPALALLRDCVRLTASLRTKQAKAFHRQMVEIADFVALAASMMDRLAAAERSRIVPALLKLLG